jgi:hypothetical protein
MTLLQVHIGQVSTRIAPVQVDVRPMSVDMILLQIVMSPT